MLKILVAEDDPHILRVISMWLSRQGHEVIETRNGAEALEQFRAQRPAIVVTDVNMPQMDGLELLTAIADEPHQPHGVVVLTNRWDHREIAERLEASRVEVMPKPFSPSRLAALIDQLGAAEPPATRTPREALDG